MPCYDADCECINQAYGRWCHCPNKVEATVETVTASKLYLNQQYVERFFYCSHVSIYAHHALKTHFPHVYKYLERIDTPEIAYEMAGE